MTVGKKPSAVGIAFSTPVVWVALKTSLVVGSLLNFANQSYALLYDWRGLKWLPLVVNYAVPYCVATYSATSALLRARKRERT